MTVHRKWEEHKESLVKKGLLNPIFISLKTISFTAAGENSFEPLLISRHAQRLGELVDRCLSIRKDIRDLEVMAVKAETDYDLFTGTSDGDEQMEHLRLQIPAKTSDQAGFEKGAATFATSSTLEQALAEIAQGHDTALGEELKSSAMLQTLISTKWQKVREYQDAYHARYTEAGNAHNYAERAKLLLEVLAVLMREALDRALALADGVQQIYAVKVTAPPTSVDLQTIDEFAVWALTTIRALSRAAEQETVSDVVIPVVQPWLLSEQPLIAQADFKKAIAGGSNKQPIKLTFQIPSGGVLDPQTRLKGVGVSFGNAFSIVSGSGIDRNQTADAFTRLMLKVSTPPQIAADGTSYSRPPLLIGNVGLHGTNVAGTVVEGNSIENISPFGAWAIEVHPFFVWKDDNEQKINAPTESDPITDLKVTLRFYVPGTLQ
jgi:hypothetical protein